MYIIIFYTERYGLSFFSCFFSLQMLLKITIFPSRVVYYLQKSDRTRYIPRLWENPPLTTIFCSSISTHRTAVFNYFFFFFFLFNSTSRPNELRENFWPRIYTIRSELEKRQTLMHDLEERLRYKTLEFLAVERKSFYLLRIKNEAKMKLRNYN